MLRSGISLEVLVQPEGAQEGFFRSPETFAVAIPGTEIFNRHADGESSAGCMLNLLAHRSSTPEDWNVRQMPTEIR